MESEVETGEWPLAQGWTPGAPRSPQKRGREDPPLKPPDRIYPGTLDRECLVSLTKEKMNPHCLS